jgi:DNA polymerase I-like protein with 3'-5' exonuclease and polymerase domains
MRAYADAGNRAYRAYSGRTIWLPRGRSHAAGNYAIQGSARELLVDGALKWHQTRWGKLPLLPIHDELLLFVPAAEAAEALEALKACMRTTLNGVPIEAAADEPFQAWPDSS